MRLGVEFVTPLTWYAPGFIRPCSKVDLSYVAATFNISLCCFNKCTVLSFFVVTLPFVLLEAFNCSLSLLSLACAALQLWHRTLQIVWRSVIYLQPTEQWWTIIHRQDVSHFLSSPCQSLFSIIQTHPLTSILSSVYIFANFTFERVNSIQMGKSKAHQNTVFLSQCAWKQWKPLRKPWINNVNFYSVVIWISTLLSH